VYSGTGVATAMKVGTVNVEFGNIRVAGNTFSSTNTNGNLNFTPAGSGSVVISKVDIQSGSIVSDDATITGGFISNVVFTGSFVGITLIESDKFSTKNSSNGVSLESNNVFAEGTSADLDLNIAAKGTGSVNFSHKFGYAAGTGGSVTQLTNKSTAVTLNKLSGRITMSNAALNRNSGISFVLNNSFIAPTDIVIVNIVSGATVNIYTATIDAITTGACTIHLRNHSTGTDLSEAVVLNFVVIKGEIT
jgi:hypothetical protein